MKLVTEIAGTGESLVFLHTGLQTGKTDFEYQKRHFRPTYQVITPDLRGHGQSVSEDLSDFFIDSANDLAETLDEMGVESAHIVGCSLGGLVGLFFAKAYPQKVKSLTLSGILAEKPDNWAALHKEDAEHQAGLLQNEEATSYFASLHQSDWREFLMMGQEEAWYPFETTKDLDGIDAPILYMVGEGNPAETRSAVLYATMGENVHTAIIPFASHLVHAEQPEIYTNILATFLGRVSQEKTAT